MKKNSINLKIKTKMQKSELMAKIADKTGITKTVVNKVCETFMDKIVETLKNGGESLPSRASERSA